MNTTQQSVLGDSLYNSLAFGKLLADDLYSNINQTDNSTVYITPRYNTTGKTELKVLYTSSSAFIVSKMTLALTMILDWRLVAIHSKKR